MSRTANFSLFARVTFLVDNFGGLNRRPAHNKSYNTYAVV